MFPRCPADATRKDMGSNETSAKKKTGEGGESPRILNENYLGLTPYFPYMNVFSPPHILYCAFQNYCEEKSPKKICDVFEIPIDSSSGRR